MSTIITTTTTDLENDNSMADASSSGPIKLSLQSPPPVLSLSSSSNSDEKNDNGLCQQLSQMSIETDATTLNPDAWREYYQPDEDGDVQLHLAIASGYVDVVHALIRMAPHPDYLSIQNKASYAPLHIAVMQNQPNLVRRLVIVGARLDIRDGEGNTPLHLAARRGYVECAEALLKPVSVQEMQLARQENQQPTIYVQLCLDIIDLKNHQGETCAHLSAMGGHIEFLRFLCWNNADMNGADGRGGRTALHFAVGSRNTNVIQCLIENRPQGCGVDVNRLDWFGRTPYQLALSNGLIDVANYLARTVSGCDLTPLEEASGSDADSTDEWKNSQILLDSSA